uniref:Uncharacterized protein n=1 Tax=Ascaris lumbricoides TaxID=6252 RepID=A0A0M3IBB8_ASCLU
MFLFWIIICSLSRIAEAVLCKSCHQIEDASL